MPGSSGGTLSGVGPSPVSGELSAWGCNEPSPEQRSDVARTVVVVDDHEVVRAGVRTAITQAGCGCMVVGEAGSVAEAYEVIERTEPDIAIVDVVLPDGDGIQLCRELRVRHPETTCLLLTSFPEPGAMLSAALAGAAAYLAKDRTATDLAGIIAEVGQGRRLLDDEAVSALLEQLSSLPAEEPSLRGLTGQERRVFELIGQGLSNRQIAERLHLTERTVKNYSSRLLSKLGMERRSEAAALSARLAERRAQRQTRPE
jgi:two-component system, NarL family, response regulator DevR